MKIDDLVGLKIVGVKQVFTEENRQGKIIFKILDDNNPNNKIYWVLSYNKGTLECKGNIRNTLGFPIVWINIGYYNDNTHIIDYYTQNKELVILRLLDSEFDIEVISDSPIYSRYYDRLHNDLICLKRQGEDNFLTAGTLNKHIITYYPSIIERKEQKK